MTETQRDDLLVLISNQIKELTEIKQNMVTKEELRGEVSAIKEELSQEIVKTQKEVRNISQTVARIEVNHGDKLEALFDAFKMHDENFMNQENRITICEKKLDNHNDEIYYLNKKIKGA